jgi:hypothetical protein
MPPHAGAPHAGAEQQGLPMQSGALGQWQQPHGAGKQQNGLKALGWTHLNFRV